MLAHLKSISMFTPARTMGLFRVFLYYVLGGFLLVAGNEILAQGRSFDAPPQQQGLAYTRSSLKAAMGAIGNTTALCAGSRYAWVRGYKVRLDTLDILRAEAILHNGGVYVPVAFAPVLVADKEKPNPVPQGLEILKDRWVYPWKRAKVSIPASVPRAPSTTRITWMLWHMPKAWAAG
jgi:hypothetical protein